MKVDPAMRRFVSNEELFLVFSDAPGIEVIYPTSKDTFPAGEISITYSVTNAPAGLDESTRSLCFLVFLLE